MSIDRSLTVRFVKWKSFFKPKHAACACAACMAVLTLVNSNVFMTFGGEGVVNGTIVTVCIMDNTELTFRMSTWGQVSNWPFYSVLGISFASWFYNYTRFMQSSIAMYQPLFFWSPIRGSFLPSIVKRASRFIVSILANETAISIGPLCCPPSYSMWWPHPVR